MRWKDVNLNPDDRMLRQFGALLDLFCLFMAVRLTYYYQQFQTAFYFGIAAGLCGLIAALRPSLFKYVFVASVTVTFPIGWVVSHVILFVLYFGLMTPLALVFRLTGRDALNLKPVAKTDVSFWSAKTINPDKGSYFKQF